MRSLASILLLTSALVYDVHCIHLQGANAVQPGPGGLRNPRIKGISTANQWNTIGVTNGPLQFQMHSHVTAGGGALSAMLGANQANGIVSGNHLKNTNRANGRMWQMISDFAEINQIQKVRHLIFYDVVEPGTCPEVANAFESSAGEPTIVTSGSGEFNKLMNTPLGGIARNLGNVLSIYVTGGPTISQRLDTGETVDGGATLVFNYVNVPASTTYPPASHIGGGQAAGGGQVAGGGDTHGKGCCVVQRGVGSGTPGSTDATAKECKCPPAQKASTPAKPITQPKTPVKKPIKKTTGKKRRNFQA